MIAVPIRYRRSQRALFVQKLQHAVPSIVVLGDGIEHLSHDRAALDLALGAVEVVVSVLVIGSVIRGFRQLRQAHGEERSRRASSSRRRLDRHQPRRDAERRGVCEVSRDSGHVPRPTMLLAVVMFAIGVLHGRLAAWGDRRRELRVGADGISVPARQVPAPDAAVGRGRIDRHRRSLRRSITATDGRIAAHRPAATSFQPKAVRDALHAGEHFSR